MLPEMLRLDFPILQKRIAGKPIIYFDNACMTLKPTPVIAAMDDYYENFPACVGRSAHKLGKLATERYARAREKVAKLIGARPEEVVFTRNTTEGINLIANCLNLKSGDIVLTTDKEHNSNLLPWQQLKEKGVIHRICFSKPDGTFDLDSFKKNLDGTVKLVSMVHTSNLDGTTIPAEEIIKLAHKNGSLVLLDAAQSVPHKKIDVKKMDVDFLAFSGHKMCGPTGVGILYGKFDLLKQLKPFMVGGDTVKTTTYTSAEFLLPPEKFEAGLQNYAGAIGLGAAAEYLQKIGLENVEKHEIELNKFITEEISKIPGVKILGPQNPELRCGIISFVIEGMDMHYIAQLLDNLENIAVRSGQHCVHSWFNANKVPGSVRASLYFYNTKEEARIFIDTLKKVCALR
jgi:cysteine desulfurase/selenocysteine lyase